MINDAPMAHPPASDDQAGERPEANAPRETESRRRAPHVRQSFYLDLTDLMEYAKHNGTLSGIQRVVSSILTYARDWAKTQTGYEIVAVVPEYDRYRVFAVDFDRVVTMIRLIEELQGNRWRIDAAISAVYDSRYEVHPRKGDLFVVAGAFWIYAHYDLIMRLRAEGVVFGLFVHDLIQIKNPEFVHKEATLVFRRSLVDALSVANFVLTNSHFVAGEVAEFLEQRLDFDLPIAAVPLATELRVRPGTGATSLPAEVEDILSRDFVLCVGTIEVRKNHLLLVKIWERLTRELGEDIPDLVFVGKWGWDIGPLRKYLHDSDFLGGRVRVLTDASDAALVELYRHCLMTAYLSFAEGFGLPAGESLAYGKPCVASRATSLPEVGGRFARYIDPHDPAEGVELFKTLFTHRDEIDRWSADIRANYAPKTWRAFTFEFLDACCRLAKSQAPRLANNCLLPIGAVYQLGNGAIAAVEDDARSLSTLRMARDAAWHALEDWGCWSSEREAALAFRVKAPAGAALAVGLKMHAPPDSEEPSVLVRINDAAPKRFALYRSPVWFAVEGAVGADGEVQIRFECDGEFGRPDSRYLYLGLDALDIRNDSPEARRALRRRSLTTRMRAATRRAAARVRKRARILSGGDSAERLRRIARDAVDEALAEDLRAGAGLRALGPRGESVAPLALAVPALGVLTTPAGAYMTAANCLGRDFYAAEFAAFCASVGLPVELHRRLWEYAFAACHLGARGALGAAKRGLAISSAEDPLPELFEAKGCEIERVAPGENPAEGRRFDFLWSIGATLTGAPESARRRVVDLVDSRLKDGGVGVFTGELNLSDYSRPELSEGPFTRNDIDEIVRALNGRGHGVAPLPFELGLTAVDAFVDVPPYTSGVHLKVLQRRSLVTCFGLIVVAGQDNSHEAMTAGAA